ncbi:hypothetical protein TRVL_10096 [Trypanosoma vivax]|nr:hypothetical protein TRVL_10096 [Trypanosoma vivax]
MWCYAVHYPNGRQYLHSQCTFCGVQVELALHWGVQQMLRGASCLSVLRGRATEIIYFFDALLHSQLRTPKRFSGACRTRIFLGNRKSSCLRAGCWQGERGPLHSHVYG